MTMRCPACPGILLEDDDDTQRAAHYTAGPTYTSYTCDMCLGSVLYAADTLDLLTRLQERLFIARNERANGTAYVPQEGVAAP